MPRREEKDVAIVIRTYFYRVSPGPLKDALPTELQRRSINRMFNGLTVTVLQSFSNALLCHGAV